MRKFLLYSPTRLPWMVAGDILVNLAPVGFGEVGFDTCAGHHVDAVLGVVKGL